jgi:tRNA-dihydrouridine synthase
MLGRGVYGRPWLAAALERGLAGLAAAAEPDAETRLAIVLDHLQASLSFYGDRLGLRIFRKHLAWYIDQAPWPAGAEARRAARSALCRLDDPSAVVAGLTHLWLNRDRIAQAA